jgi:hypothetical protein
MFVKNREFSYSIKNRLNALHQCCGAGACRINLVEAGDFPRCGSGGSGSDNGIKHDKELKNDVKCL